MDMRKYIGNILKALRIARMSNTDRLRCHGALECALQVVGVLSGTGKPFDYKKIDVVDDYIFFKHRHCRKEKYGEMIERLAAEWLARQEVKG